MCNFVVDFVRQNLSKIGSFSPSYSKYKVGDGALFLRHGVEYSDARILGYPNIRIFGYQASAVVESAPWKSIVSYVVAGSLLPALVLFPSR